MEERKARELVKNIHDTRSAIAEKFGLGRSHLIEPELDAWVDEIGVQLDRGRLVFRAQHLDHAHEQVSVIRSALARGDFHVFLAESTAAIEKLGDIRKIAQADAVLPGIGEDITGPAKPQGSSGRNDDDDDRESRFRAL